MLKTEGRGRFCGVMLHVWNPRGGWWGEGDEKFFVDGEKFPSTFGTGSEDYFGYAWCNPTLFQNCYHNQTISMNNRGHISVNRWHITDNVPFQTSFEAAIEKYYPNSRPTLYASTVYWYQAAGQKDPYEPVAVDQRKGYWTPIEVFKIKGIIEGETLAILAKTGGNTSIQDMSGWGEAWSNEALWWTEGKPGNTLELALPVEKAGTYRLTVQLTKAIDYGIVQLSLDDTKLGGPIDLYNNGVIATGPIDLGTHELAQGRHVLKVEIIGANEKAVKSYMFGLDYVKLESTATSKEVPNAASRVRGLLLVCRKTPIIRSWIPARTRSASPSSEPTLSTRAICAASPASWTRTAISWAGATSGNLEGPGWAANAVGGAYELYAFGLYDKNPTLQEKACDFLTTCSKPASSTTTPASSQATARPQPTGSA